MGEQLSEKSRSLWNRIQSEIVSGGIKRVQTYIQSAFKQKFSQTIEALNSFKDVDESEI